MTEIWPREVSRKIQILKQISKTQKWRQAGKLPPRPGRPGGRLGSRPAHQVDWGVDPRVDLGVDLPGRAQVTWVHLVGFSGCVLKAGRNLMALIYSRVNLMA